jgi:NADPH-dependent glutamate synthase beta subunit-like oxidoreductase
VAGGLLATGIPEYRLPKDVLNRDIEYIRRAGVEIETGRRIGSLQELRDAGFNAIFIAVGAQKGRTLDVPGEDAEGVEDALRFLRRVTLGELKHLSGRVVVVGGGNAAIDSARTALRLGAESVTLLYRRGREEMPALAEEVEEAELEGVDMRFLEAPVAVERGGERKEGTLPSTAGQSPAATGPSLREASPLFVRCVQMELGEADEGGRRRPVPKPGSEVVVEADHLIAAIGQGPELDFAASDGRLVVSRGWVTVHPVTQRSGESDVFAGGDAVTGAATIVEAVAAGQRAAQAIDVFLGGKGELPSDTGFASRTKPDESQAAIARRSIRALSSRRRKGNFQEVLKGYSLRAACAEARRCLRCDLEE